VNEKVKHLRGAYVLLKCLSICTFGDEICQLKSFNLIGTKLWLVLEDKGVAMRKIGVPFVPPHTIFYNPVPPAVVGGVVYGCLGFGLASVMGKRI
jgi:hypothetical protein